MQKFAENLSLLLLNLGALETAPTVQQSSIVIQSLKELKGLAHNVEPTLELYTVDPVMRYLSLDLPKQFSRIEAAYTAQNYGYARFLLRQTTSYCVGCHASSSIKKSAVMQFAEPSPQLSELEKAEYFSATRRHDEAMLAYEKFLADRLMKHTDPDRWLKALQNLLALTIRLRGDASITLEMISARLDEGGYSPEQEAMLMAWRSSAKSWSTEPLGKNYQAHILLEKAQQLAAKAEGLNKKGQGRGFIEQMRTMSLLNQISMGDAGPEVKAKTFLATGKTSEQLQGIFVWMHPEAYYEACIRIKPHSVTAKACWAQLDSYQKGRKDALLDKQAFSQLSELSR